MRYLFLLMVATMVTLSAEAQRLPLLHAPSHPDVDQVSLANPYVGSVKLAYNLDSDKPLNENIIFSAGAQLTPIKTERFALPLLGIAGIGSGDIINPGSGLNIGAFPYYIISQTESLQFIAHGGVNYKKLVEGDELEQLRFLGGLEVIYAKGVDDLPLTLSLTPVYLYHRSETLDNTAALEFTAVIPLAQGLGLLAEAFAPFTAGFPGQFRFAVVTTI